MRAKAAEDAINPVPAQHSSTPYSKRADCPLIVALMDSAIPFTACCSTAAIQSSFSAIVSALNRKACRGRVISAEVKYANPVFRSQGGETTRPRERRELGGNITAPRCANQAQG